MNLDKVQQYLLKEIADISDVPAGAYNIRSNSQSIGRQSTPNIKITPKTDVSGIDIRIKEGKIEEIKADLALEENERHRFAYSYDLGTLWQKWQGLPFVFGAWLISKDALSTRLRPVLDDYMLRLETSIREFRKNPSQALDVWLAKYPVNLPRPLVEDYFSVLDYHFTDERKQSLTLFFKLAAQMGLVESAPPIEFLE